jgi:hypothetical protein
MTDWRDKFLVALLILLPAGCAVLQSIDPVQDPPLRYQSDTTATVEFLAAEAIVPRCLERGANVLANACADQELITITNPCNYQGDGYARRLCHELAHINSWPSDHSDPKPIPLASESPQAIAAAGK